MRQLRLKKVVILGVLFISTLIPTNAVAQEIMLPITDDARNVGNGLAPGSLKPKKTCVNGEEIEQKSRSLDVEAYFVRDFQSFSQSIYSSSNFDGAVATSKVGFSQVKNSFMQRKSNSLFFVIKVSQTSSVKYLKNPKIDSNGIKALNAGEDVFVKHFGTHYIDREVRGGLSFILVEFESSSQKLKSSISSSNNAKLSYSSMSASAKAEFKKEIEKEIESGTAKITMKDIGTPILKSLDIKLTSIDKAVEILKNIKTDGVLEEYPLYQVVKPYSEMSTGDFDLDEMLFDLENYWDEEAQVMYNNLSKKHDDLSRKLYTIESRIGGMLRTTHGGKQKVLLEKLTSGINALQSKKAQLEDILTNMTKTGKKPKESDLNFLNEVSEEEQLLEDYVTIEIGYSLNGLYYTEENDSIVDCATIDLSKISSEWLKQLQSYSHHYDKFMNRKVYNLDRMEGINIVDFHYVINSLYGRSLNSHEKETRSCAVVNYSLTINEEVRELMYNGYFKNDVKLCYMEKGEMKYPPYYFHSYDLFSIIFEQIPVITENTYSNKTYNYYYPKYRGLGGSATFDKDKNLMPYEIETLELVEEAHNNPVLNNHIKIMQNINVQSDNPFMYLEFEDVLGVKYYVPFLPLDKIRYLQQEYPTIVKES